MHFPSDKLLVTFQSSTSMLYIVENQEQTIYIAEEQDCQWFAKNSQKRYFPVLELHNHINQNQKKIFSVVKEENKRTEDPTHIFLR